MALYRLVWVLLLVLAGCNAKRPEVERGRHLATVTGCTSCHGIALDGHVFEEEPEFAVAWSSNLSRILPRWSDDEIEQALRTGKRPDGSALWFMPTFAHRRLSPQDMRDLIGWLRTVPPTGVDHPTIKRGPQFAVAVERGFQDSAAEAVRLAPRAPIDAGPALATGRYLSVLACSECHGPDLKGVKNAQPGDPPDLVVAVGYSPTAFAKLLKTGVGQDGRPAGGMAEEARKRLSALDEDEVGAIHAYLRARPAR